MKRKKCKFCDHQWETKEYVCPKCGESLTSVYLPSKEAIEQGIQDIRGRWTPDQEASRRVVPVSEAGPICVMRFNCPRGLRDSSDY